MRIAGRYLELCGTQSDERPDGNLEGWNSNNPGNAPGQDAPYVITLRPLPVALDPLGYAQMGGHREKILDAYAPWVYRLTFLELERECFMELLATQKTQERIEHTLKTRKPLRN